MRSICAISTSDLFHGFLTKIILLEPPITISFIYISFSNVYALSLSSGFVFKSIKYIVVLLWLL